jgi:excisionase family DNA binding protein
MSTDPTIQLASSAVLTVDQVAARFQLSSKTIYRTLERRQLRAAKFGSAWRIRETDADAWFEGAIPDPTLPTVTPRRRTPLSPRVGSLRALEVT